MQENNQIPSIPLHEALEKGYTHFNEEASDTITPFIDVVHDMEEIERLRTVTCYIVDMKAPKRYSIDADTIKELIKDHVNEQENKAFDEFGDKYDDTIEKHDFSDVAAALNAKFAEFVYYEPIDLEVKF